MGFSAIGPMLDMVGIHKTATGAARELTAFIPALQYPPQSRGNGAGFTACIHGFAILLLPMNQPGVTSQSSRGFKTDVGRIFQLRLGTATRYLKRFEVGVNIDHQTF